MAISRRSPQSRRSFQPFWPSSRGLCSYSVSTCISNTTRPLPAPRTTTNERGIMIILGVVLWVIGLIAKIAILQTAGIIIGVIGVALLILGSTGRSIGG